MSYTRLKFLTLDQQVTDSAVNLLNKACAFRVEGKPERWALDVERRALRKFEHSFVLRHLFDASVERRPDFLPPCSYSNR